MKKVLNKRNEWSRSGHEYGCRLPPVKGWRPVPVRPRPKSEFTPEQWMTTSSDYGHGWYLNHQTTFTKYNTKQNQEIYQKQNRRHVPALKLVPFKVQQEELLHPTVVVGEELFFPKKKPIRRKHKGLLSDLGPMNFSFHTPWHLSTKFK